MQFPPIKKGGANVPNSNVPNPAAIAPANPGDANNYVKNIKKDP
jgi:hypothetical protein